MNPINFDARNTEYPGAAPRAATRRETGYMRADRMEIRRSPALGIAMENLTRPTPPRTLSPAVAAPEDQLDGAELAAYSAVLQASPQVKPGVYDVSGFADGKAQGMRMMCDGWVQSMKTILDGSTDAGLRNHCEQLDRGIVALNQIKNSGNHITSRQLAEFLRINHMAAVLLDTRAGKLFPPSDPKVDDHGFRELGITVECLQPGVRQVAFNLYVRRPFNLAPESGPLKLPPEILRQGVTPGEVEAIRAQCEKRMEDTLDGLIAFSGVFTCTISYCIGQAARSGTEQSRRRDRIKSYLDTEVNPRFANRGVKFEHTTKAAFDLMLQVSVRLP